MASRGCHISVCSRHTEGHLLWQLAPLSLHQIVSTQMHRAVVQTLSIVVTILGSSQRMLILCKRLDLLFTLGQKPAAASGSATSWPRYAAFALAALLTMTVGWQLKGWRTFCWWRLFVVCHKGCQPQIYPGSSREQLVDVLTSKGLEESCLMKVSS